MGKNGITIRDKTANATQGQIELERKGESKTNRRLKMKIEIE